MTISFEKYTFHPVIELPPEYEVSDFSRTYDPARKPSQPFGIGKYNEKRPNMYCAPLFGGVRNIHMGIDIAAPVGTEVRSFWEGEIYLFGYNAAPGDYGHTLITRHVLEDVELYALYGHLNERSTLKKTPGQRIKGAEVIAWVGAKHENGGWNPHLHFQLSYERPSVPDMPGVVSDEQLNEALLKYPDPRLVLGPLY